MHIPQDVVGLIIDELVSLTPACPMPDPFGLDSERKTCMRATSLVSTAWVNPSQRHLFSVITFPHGEFVLRWCSRTRPGPHGVSRHVRSIWWPSVPLPTPNMFETVFLCLTSFQNLQELWIGCAPYERHDADQSCLDVAVPILSSFAGTLKRFHTGGKTPDETWGALYAIANLLPNITDLDLVGEGDKDLCFLPRTLPRIQLSIDEVLPDPLTFKHFKFRELKLKFMYPIPPSPPFLEYCQTHLQALDLQGSTPISWVPDTRIAGNLECLRVFFKSCYVLQEITFSFDSYIGRILDSIPSSSVSLIRLHEPEGVTKFSSYRDQSIIPEEWGRLGVSIRNVAQRFSNNRRGLKMRVQVIHQAWDPSTAKPLLGYPERESDEISFFMTKLGGELGSHATLELNVLPCLPGPRDVE